MCLHGWTGFPVSALFIGVLTGSGDYASPHHSRFAGRHLITHSDTNLGGKWTHNLPTYHNSHSHLQPHDCLSGRAFAASAQPSLMSGPCLRHEKRHSENFWGEVSQCVLCCVVLRRLLSLCKTAAAARRSNCLLPIFSL